MFPPDGLLASEQTKHDVELNPHTTAPDPFASDDCLNDFSAVHQFLLNKRKEETKMNPGADELSSGLNGRLRPRKLNIPNPQSTKLVRKSEGKTGQDKAKRTSAATKTPPNKTDDLATKSDSNFLCPYCDKKFASKQTLYKHVRRMHGASSKQDSFITCLFCSHYEADANEIIRHMAETHCQQYFACLNCHTRFSSSCELADHKIKSCETRLPYRSRLRQKMSTSSKETIKHDFGNESKDFSDGHSFNGVVISCELKPSQVNDGADIEDNITTNLILPPSKSLGSSNTVIEKSAVIVLDDIQWNKRIPPNFSFHNTDADQILSRLGVVHRSPRTGESTKKDWKNLDETTQKFEKCFDTSFYSKVASNVQENLSKFLDGSFNFNPDPDSTIKTRKAKNSVMINTAEGFPILLASEQYSRNAFDRYMPRAIAPKHKWKWDSLENDKGPLNADQIKRDSHTNNCIISLVSSLDIWTQLRMRHKFEEKFGCPPLEKKTEKQTIISNELKIILESRELPSPSSQVIKVTKKSSENTGRNEFPLCLGLTPAPSSYELQPAVLSGEWVRPRCYVCCACGAQSQDSRAVSTHISTHHPNAQVQHYEIVGEQLLNADILKHLYVPPSQICNRTRPPRGFRECTKCRKSITLDDLHQHMLDCAGDTPAVRRKCRYRPFGVRKRRPRLPDNTIRKKIRKDIRRTRTKALMRPRPIRTEVGDAETIRKMIADLPAKRHRVLVNPPNPSLRPRIKQRPKILMKRRPSEDRGKRIKRNKESIKTRPRQGSPANETTSVKSDEDNKPLKPKVRRVATKPPRRTETDKRKSTTMTRAKRPNRQIKKIEKNDKIKEETSRSKNLITENISIENSPNRIDVNNEDFSANDHAGQGQGNSNNRGGRPGSSSQNENSENRCAPVQNVPLKHSIARLTADSEKHDKSVQFHHLFLVQQECNNVNQHVQSGQQVLFENEAAVLTLDKPPLHCSTKGPLDALQKSKLNKPRKGLNACIAMLKNKLVEPAAEPAIPAGHVSVQCGDDEPLYVKPDTALHTSIISGNNAEIMTKPETIQETCQKNSVSTAAETRQSPTQDKIDINNTVKDKSGIISQNSEKQHNTGSKREFSHQKSQVNEDKAVGLPSLSHIPTQATVTRAVPAPVSVSPKVMPIEAKASTSKKNKQPNVESVKSKRQTKLTDMSEDIQHTKLNVVQHSTLQLSLDKPHETKEKQLIKSQTSKEKQLIQSQTPEEKQLMQSQTPKEKQLMQSQTPKETQLIQSQTPEEKQLMQSQTPKETQLIQSQTPEEKQLMQSQTPKEKQLMQSQTPKEKQLIQSQTPKEKLLIQSLVEPTNSSTINHQNDKKTTMNEQSKAYYLQQQTDYHSDSEYTLKVSVDNFPSPELTHVPVNNRPAHASTHVESIVSVPLDLSGKMSNVNTSPLLNPQNTYAYENYETLDLSNKSQDLICRGETAPTSNDEIVDLSIKTSHLKSANVSGKEDVTDLSLRSCASIDVPTDLTVKKKVTDISTKHLLPDAPENRDLPPKQDTSNLNRPVNVLLENQINQLSSSDPGNKDKKAGCTSGNYGTASVNITEKVYQSNEGNVPATKSENNQTTFSETSFEKMNENIPADLSSQHRTEDYLIEPKCPIPVPLGKRENEGKKKHEKSCEMHQRMYDNASVQKHVYDPTLRIPQYKIRAGLILDNLTNMDSSANTSSLVNTTSSPTFPLVPNYSETAPICTQSLSTAKAEGKTSVDKQDQTLFAYGAVPMNAPGSIKNCGVTSQFSKFESTTPVYSLDKACISVTKIESSKSTTLTNTLLSIPGSTIANTTPVYTLAGTTIGVQAKYSQFASALPPNSTIQKNNEEIIPGTSSQSKTQYEQGLDAHKEKVNNANLLSNADQDPETARKIALLPKELVDVLGNMPVDHRNRLLNILPQYVSTPSAETGSKSDLSSQSESTVNLSTPTEPKENKISSTAKSKREPECKMTSPLFIAQQDLLCLSNSSVTHGENDPPRPQILHSISLPTNRSSNSDDNVTTGDSYATQTHQISKDEPRKESKDGKPDVVPEESFATLTTNKLSHDVSTVKVIDLTEDETVPRTEIYNEPVIDAPPQMSLLVQTKRNKSHNDQTASLRAVRIKASSARQRSIDCQLSKCSSIATILTNKIINNEQDNEVDKSLHMNFSLNTDISLAIQQAEVSSTQHSNKNVTAECKFPSVTSPIIQESNLDETNNCTSRRLSTTSKDENMRVDDIQNIKSVVKTTLVTSSVVNNDINKDPSEIVAKKLSPLNSDHSNTKYIRGKLDVSSGDNEITKDSPTTMTQSNLGSEFDISLSYEPLTKCSTPKPKAVIENKTESMRTSPDRRLVITREDQEDSDDDLSLAVICKQKHQTLLKKDQVDDVNKTKKEVRTAIKKNDKKNKKNVVSVNATRVSAVSNNNTVTEILLEQEKQVTVIDMEKDEPPKTSSDKNTKQNTRKPPRKNIANNTQSNTSVVTPKIGFDTVTVDTNKDDEVRIKDISFNTILKDDNKQSIGTSRKRSKVDEDIVKSDNIKEHSLEKNIVEAKSKPSPIRQKNKKKKRFPFAHTDSVNSETSQTSLNLDDKNNDIEITSSDMKNTLTDQDRIVQEQENIKGLNLKDKPETTINDCSQLNGPNNAQNATVPAVAIALTPCSSLEGASNMTTPLRRSRRVRSRNNSVVGEELQVDTLQENRTPLTKKQLIFSKLLLDEENNIKTPEGITGDTVDLKTPMPEVLQTSVETQESVIDENIVQERNKTIKRKNSAHLKRKCKKKKSFNTQVTSGDDNVISLHDQDEGSIVTSQEEQKSSEAHEPPGDPVTTCVPSISDSARSTADSKIIHSNASEVTELSIEKRKSGDLPHVELTQSTQPKKLKLDTNEHNSSMRNTEDEENEKLNEASFVTNRSAINTNATLEFNAGSEKKKIEDPNITSPTCVDEKHTVSKMNEKDLRVKTCYNMPAGRRTRSKSAVIKSAVYDPYDIDLDDMIEHAEPLRQRKTSSEYRSAINIVKQSRCSEESKNVAINKEDNKKSILNEVAPINKEDFPLDSFSKHESSDSDDSSKSDIPLKKYVEEKEKKISDLEESVSSSIKNDIENEVNKNLNFNNKQVFICDKKKALGVNNTSDGIAQDETEEQLRSEQFMESFGFFSERKPRKSNLLATKKISETFHIIANESDDMFFGFKERITKKSSPNENRKSVEADSNLRGTRQRSPVTKKTIKRGRKKKNSTTVTTPSYCNICKKEFRRSDNFLRHQMTLLHVSKMSEVEMKIKTVPIQEEPNYLIAYKEHLDRLKIITDKMLKRKKKSKSAPKIAPLSLEEILADVNKIVREQQLSHRGLSCDEELFLDCCELLKESHKQQDHVADLPSIIKDTDNLLCTSNALQTANVGLDLLGKTDIDGKRDNKNEGDVDSITAKTILESEEVRNLENDLISGLKEAANASNLQNSGIVFQQTVDEIDTDHQQDFSDHFSSPAATESQYEQLNNYEEPEELNTMKNKKYPEFKEKMYPDIEEIDMFEDKFDKIKRKCRSQAAAAKQPQLVVEPIVSRKGRKKLDKKKGKKSSKKNHPSTVLTKGALKGFDGVKVSIPTSDINISAIVSPLEGSHKKKKKGNSRKRRENKNSESSCKYDSDHPLNDSSASLKNVDVYEFMDNEDVELFEFRPSTLMERFKSITNKDTPSTSKVSPIVAEADNSSVSASDGDDFVYMSDDYVCSDDETENSLMSCDVGNTKIPSDSKKVSSQMKKRDVVEKNAVMGKIFKNNAVRSEKKLTKSKEPAKPQANLDQLFDSLLEDEPSSSMLNDESLPLKDDDPYALKYENKTSSPKQSEELTSKYEQYQIKKKYHLSTDKENYSSKYKTVSSDNDDDDDETSFIDYGPSTSKLCLKSFIGDHKSTKPGIRPSLSPPALKPVSPKKPDNTTTKQHSLSKKHERTSFLQDDFLEDQEISRNVGIKKGESKYKDDKSPIRKTDYDIGASSDYNEIGDQPLTSDETGVARQRARRKCTVGKQNILAETWSSESEPDGGPPRPNSAESMVSGTARKKKGKKKDGQHTGGRRSNNRHISFKKQEIVSRVSSSIRDSTTHTSGANSNDVVDNRSPGGTLGSFMSDRKEPSTSAASTSGGTCKSVEEPPAIPSTSASGSTMLSATAGPSISAGCAAANPAEPTFLVPAEPGTSGGRHRAYYWSSDGGDEEQTALAREELAREELARAEQAREREQRAREEEAQQQQQQQHGWIVGDSHKKLVTMLAHAKGRKRNNNDDKRHRTE